MTALWSPRAASLVRGAAGAGARGAQGGDQAIAAAFQGVSSSLVLSLTATGDLRRGRGLTGAAQGARGDVVGKDLRHVGTLHRVLQVAFFDTVFRDAFGVPGHDERRSFSSFSGVMAWCDSNDASLRHELAALDGTPQQRGGGLDVLLGRLRNDPKTAKRLRQDFRRAARIRICSQGDLSRRQRSPPASHSKT